MCIYEDEDECPFAYFDGMRTALDGAMHYAELGYKVFPLEPNSSIPHRELGYREDGRGGIYWATNDIEQVREWFTKWPDANIGLATGRTNGIVAVDLDVPWSVARLSGELRLFLDMVNPRVWESTPSGGRHILLALPEGTGPVPNVVGLASGLDIRGDGGHITAAPSERVDSETGEILRYRWARHPTNLPRASEAFLDAIRTAPRVNRSSRATTSVGSGSGAYQVIDEEQMLREGLGRGSRNDDAHRLACRLWRRVQSGRIEEQQLWDIMRQVWNRTPGDPPFPWSECRKATMSAKRFIDREGPVVTVSENSRSWWNNR